MRPSFTIGIEEEYQTVDPTTRDLRSHIHAEVIAKGKMILEERVKPEMHQSVVEVGTGICKNIKEAKAEVTGLRRDMVRLARENGLRLASAAIHSSIRSNSAFATFLCAWRRPSHSRL